MMINKNIHIPVLILLFSVILFEVFNTRSKHPDSGLDIVGLVQRYGYPIETHTVTTDDGYILTLYRIPHGRGDGTTVKKRIPVLFMHGFMQSGVDYINAGPDKSLGLILADQGYDVWLGNARGTTPSRNHKTLNSRDTKFWDYSLHEIGTYDNPAFIDYILDTTKENSLHYVGYSQGTIVFFILGSEKPQYTSKIRLMTALAPAIYLKDPKGPVLGLLVLFRKLVQTFFYYTWWEFLPHDGFISSYLKHICDENSLFVELCLQHTFLLHGYNHDEVNKTMLPVQYSNTPAGGSTKQLMHIIQLMESGEFRQYDLGTSWNLEKYGSEVPPRYDLSKINTPVALYFSENDWTIHIKNIEKMGATIPNVVKKYRVPLDKFNHNDFIYAKNVVNLLYNAVIDEITKY